MEAPGQNGRAPRVLVVGDDNVDGVLVAQTLAGDGMEADRAGDGRAAMALMAERGYDALVVGLAPPGMDGLELCRRVRRGGFRGRAVLLTARDGVRPADWRAAGLDDSLVWPVSLHEVARSLRRPRLVALPGAGAGPGRPAPVGPPRGRERRRPRAA